MSLTPAECSENPNELNSSPLISTNNRRLLETQNSLNNYNDTFQLPKNSKKNETDESNLKPDQQSCDSDCDYSSGNDDVVAAPTVLSVTTTPAVSIDDEPGEIAVRNHFLKKFSKLKRQYGGSFNSDCNLSVSTTNIVTKNNDESNQHIKRARKQFHQDQFSETSINRSHDIDKEADANGTTRDLTNSRSSCSSNTSASSGIGSSNSNVSSETNSLISSSLLNMFPKSRSHEYRSDTNAKIIENVDSEEEAKTTDSDYEVEREDEIAVRKKKKLTQPTQCLKKQKKRYTKTTASGNSRSSSRPDNDRNRLDASLVNNLLMTMNEILTSQLILSRKVDKVNDNFNSINVRLKFIEVSCKKNMKKNRNLRHREATTVQINATSAPDNLKSFSNIHTETSKQQTNYSSNNKSSQQQQLESLDASAKKDQVRSVSLKNVHTITSRLNANLISPGSTIASNKSNNLETPKPEYPNTKPANCERGELNNNNKNHILSVSNLAESVNKLKQSHSGISFSQQQHQDHKQAHHHMLNNPGNMFPHKYFNHSSGGFDQQQQRKLPKNEFEEGPVRNLQYNPKMNSLSFDYANNKNFTNNKPDLTGLVGNISNNTELSTKLGGLPFPAQNYPFLGHQGAQIFQQNQLQQQQNHHHHHQLTTRASVPQMSQMSHQIGQPGAHPRFGNHAFLHQSTSTPSNLIMTPQAAVAAAAGKFNSNQNSITSTSSSNNNTMAAVGGGKEGLSRTLSASSTTSKSQLERQVQQQQQQANNVDDRKGAGDNNWTDSVENDENDYESGDEDQEMNYQHSNQQRETIEQAANFIFQQHGLIRHGPSGSVDQLELDEESEMLASREIIKRCARKAKHRGNFAANLAAELFNKEERVSCNCTGTRGKRQLSPRRLNLVKDITFRMYNANPALLAAASSSNPSTAAVAAAAVNAAYQDFEEAWRKECITAIDAKNRSIGRDLIKTSSSENRMQIGGSESMGLASAVECGAMSPGAVSVSYSNADSTEAND